MGRLPPGVTEADMQQGVARLSFALYMPVGAWWALDGPGPWLLNAYGWLMTATAGICLVGVMVMTHLPQLVPQDDELKRDGELMVTAFAAGTAVGYVILRLCTLVADRLDGTL